MWRVLHTLLLCSVLAGPEMQVSAGILQETGIFSTTPIDSKNGSFILPRASDLVFLDRSIINISVTADFDVAAIMMFQRGRKGVDMTTGNWVYIYPRAVSWAPLNISSEDPTLPQEYVFICLDARRYEDDIYYNYTHPESFWSPVFKITNDTAAVLEQSVSVSSSSPTSTSSHTAPESTSTRASDGDSSSANIAPVPKGGLSSTAKRDIALAVSLTLSGAAMFGVVLFLLRRRHQKQKAAKLSPATSVPSEQPPVAESHSYQAVPGQTQESKHTSEMPSELSAEGRVPRVEDLDELVTGRRK
ncbi:hypothetical protein HBI49_044430 [Parastagonospora nodorum]|nr:hypothetical protein HBI49_044430 [Parastagonospora nodorum]KAH6529889.1 hypothetical protein HBI07_171140 [Parastagonospora nodorum]